MGQELTLPEAEVQSFLFGLVSIKDLGVTKVLLCSDAVEVVKAIKGKEDSSVESIISGIQALSCYFDCFEPCHIPRELNRIAPNLAVLGRSGISRVWFQDAMI